MKTMGNICNKSGLKIVSGIFFIVILSSLFLPTSFAGYDEDIDLTMTTYPKRIFDGEYYITNVEIDDINAVDSVKISGEGFFIIQEDVDEIVDGLEENEVNEYLFEAYEWRGIDLTENAEVESNNDESENWEITDDEKFVDHTILRENNELKVQTGRNMREYGVDIPPEAAATTQIRISPEEYEIGWNEYVLKAESEGSTVEKTIRFNVLREDDPVEPFILQKNSPIYPGQSLEVFLGVYGAFDSAASDLRVRPQRENVYPEGYGVGEEMMAVPVDDFEDDEFEEFFDVPGMAPAEVEPDQDAGDLMVIGTDLYFEAENLSEEESPLIFDVEYDLDGRTVTQEVEVDFVLRDDPDISLIQTEALEITKGQTEILPLEIANEMDTEARSVSVHPPEEFEIYPTHRPLDTLEPGDYFPLDFRVHSDNIEDGEELTFDVEYRIGDEDKVTSVDIQANVEEPETNVVPIIVIVVIILIVIGALYHWRPEVFPWKS